MKIVFMKFGPIVLFLVPLLISSNKVITQLVRLCQHNNILGFNFFVTPPTGDTPKFQFPPRGHLPRLLAQPSEAKIETYQRHCVQELYKHLGFELPLGKHSSKKDVGAPYDYPHVQKTNFTYLKDFRHIFSRGAGNFFCANR